MKNTHLVLAVIAVAAMFVSCEREPSSKETKSANEIAFVLGSKVTKAAEADHAYETTTYDLGYEGLQLVEEISSLDDLYDGPATKGTPAYTTNFASLYSTFTADVYNAAGTDKINSLSNAEFAYDSDKNAWTHNYTSDPWTGNSKLWFFLRMGNTGSSVIPASGDGAISYSVASNIGKISFKYTNPSDATAQQDILFASRSLTKAEEDAGANVLFYHVLSGVKFKVADLGDNIAGIKEISFGGLKDKGTCTVTAKYGNWNKTNSNAGATDHTKSDECSVWTNLSATDGFVAKATFGTGETTGKDYTKENAGYSFPNSFFDENTGKANLNDNKFTKTFFLIPQALSESVTLTIKVVDVNGKDISFTVPFGKMTKEKNNGTAVELKAGELRTYSLKINDGGNITIEETLENAVKKNVQVKNTSGMPVYVRAIIVANWCMDVVRDGQTKTVVVAPYNDEGTYTNLATSTSGWVKNSEDGYYYYTKKVNANSPTTGNLFDSFTYAKANVPVEGAYLVMSIASQAKIALDEYSDYTDAWGLN